MYIHNQSKSTSNNTAGLHRHVHTSLEHCSVHIPISYNHPIHCAGIILKKLLRVRTTRIRKREGFILPSFISSPALFSSADLSSGLNHSPSARRPSSTISFEAGSWRLFLFYTFLRGPRWRVPDSFHFIETYDFQQPYDMGMIFRVLQVRKLRPRLLCAQRWRSFTHTMTSEPGSEPLHLHPGDSARWVRDELQLAQPCLALLGAPGLLPPPASRVANAAVGHTLEPGFFLHQDAGRGLMSPERLVKRLPSCQLAQLLPWKSPERVGRLAARHPLPWDPPARLLAQCPEHTCGWGPAPSGPH